MKKNNIIAIFPTERDLRELGMVNKKYGYNLIFYGKNPRNHIKDFDISYCIKDILSFMKNKSIDAIIGTHDYPATLIASIICKKLGLSSPDVTSILICQHKYYCRQYQKKCVPEAYVESKIISPFKSEKIPFDFPFFIKPVRSFFSIMAAKIENIAQYKEYLVKAKKHFSDFNKPFNFILKEYPEYQYNADHLIAERLIIGKQVTIEAYCFHNEVHIIGIVDSKMHENKISFKRFDYPTTLKKSIKNKIEEITRKIIKYIGFDNGVLNIEYFINASEDQIKIIEINPRICSQFADLMEKVNGINTYEVQLSIALGGDPKNIRKEKYFKYATSFVLREFKDKKIKSLPDQKCIGSILRKYPDARIEIYGKEGDMLSRELNDMASYRYGLINIGENSKSALYTKYDKILEALDFQFEG
jgi:hypothetical protein